MLDRRTINLIAKQYDALHYHSTLVELLTRLYPLKDLEDYTKFDLHKLLNKTIVNYYNGEEIVKYKLFQYHKNIKNITAAFETKVNTSRIDFIVLNGYSTSFEIKSELDNLSKIPKQVSDYLKVFEYNNLVISKRHVDKIYKILPESYGLWIYSDGKFNVEREASKNFKIDVEFQLNLLNKIEIRQSFPQERGQIEIILQSYDSETINGIFKEALRSRYRQRWNFLLKNYKNILPIDIQFFFNNNISPDQIYLY